MSERRTLGLLGFLLGLLGGALILAGSLGGFDHGFANLNLTTLVYDAISILLGLAIIFGGVLMFRRQYSSGGIVNLVLGIIVLILGVTVAGVIALVSGVLGLMAAEARG